jgi:hypothetical protein
MGVWEWIAEKTKAAFLEGFRRASETLDTAEVDTELRLRLGPREDKQLPEAEPKRRSGR